METQEQSAAPAKLPTASTQHALPNVFTRRSLHPHLITQCQNLFFRQSFINDYLKCPQMALYRWVLNLDQSAPFMSATLGTAGHGVAYHFHVSRKYDYTYMEILDFFETEFRKQIKKDKLYPTLPKNCSTPEEAFSLKGPEYAKLLLGYQKHPRNKEFNSTFHEQSFVLDIPAGDGGPNYLFTGQIDQGGYYDSGAFAIRDFKFRDNAFRPSKIELDLNVQATVYCAAVKFGKPACEKCRPRNVRDQIDNTIVLEYHGPCDQCQAKIGTPLWPQKYASTFEFIWMNDFDVHEKDQHPEEVIDNTKEKIPNPKGKGQKVYPRVRNPDYDSGYKRGEYVGIGFMQTIRPPSALNVMMSDVLNVCDQIRSGKFFRNPGDTCNFMCKHRDSCMKGRELQIEEAALDQVSAIGTDDPW